MPRLQPGDAIVIDNASFHHSQYIEDVVATAGCELCTAQRTKEGKAIRTFLLWSFLGSAAFHTIAMASAPTAFWNSLPEAEEKTIEIVARHHRVSEAVVYANPSLNAWRCYDRSERATVTECHHRPAEMVMALYSLGLSGGSMIGG